MTDLLHLSLENFPAPERTVLLRRSLLMRTGPGTCTGMTDFFAVAFELTPNTYHQVSSTNKYLSRSKIWSMNAMQPLPAFKRPRIAVQDLFFLPCGGAPRYLGALLVKSGLHEGYCEAPPLQSAVSVLSQGGCSSHYLTVTVLHGSSLSHSGASER